MLEKRLAAVPPQPFTADGTEDGVVTISAGACSLFKVKQKIYIAANNLPTLYLEIKEIDSESNIHVGPIAGTLGIANTGITARTDISKYLMSLDALIFADEQKRVEIGQSEIVRATYDEEPAVAVRTVLVDECGDRYNDNNPLFVEPSGPSANITNNLLAMLVQGPANIPPTNYIVNNEKFFIFDNEGNLIGVG